MKTRNLTLALSFALLAACDPTGRIDGTPTFGASSAGSNVPPDGPDPLPEGAFTFGPTPVETRFCGNHLPDATMSLGLLVPQVNQRGGTWCVLATNEMLAKYYGLSVDQCKLVDQRNGFPEGTCCGWPINAACDTMGTYIDAQTRLLATRGLYGLVVRGAVEEPVLVSELSNGRPVALAVSGALNGHSILVAGLEPAHDGEPAIFEVLDPGDGQHLLTYNQLRSRYWSGSAVWDTTIIHLAPSADGCNRQFDPDCGCDAGLAAAEEEPLVADGTPMEPFGNYDPAAFAGDLLEPAGPVNFVDFVSRASTVVAPSNPDALAFNELVRSVGGRPADAECAALNELLPLAGDCCAPDADYTSAYGPGFPPPPPPAEPAADGTVPPVPLQEPLRSCSQRVTTWNVSPALANHGVSGLHLARPLTLAELRREMANGRQVLAKSDYGGFVLFAGWAPVDESLGGGERIMVVRQGSTFRWSTYLEIAEMRESLVGRWTDTWFRLRAN